MGKWERIGLVALGIVIGFLLGILIGPPGSRPEQPSPPPSVSTGPAEQPEECSARDLSTALDRYAIGQYVIALVENSEATFEDVINNVPAPEQISEEDVEVIIGDIIVAYGDQLEASGEENINREKAINLLKNTVLFGLPPGIPRAVGEALGLRVENMSENEIISQVAEIIVGNDQKILEAAEQAAELYAQQLDTSLTQLVICGLNRRIKKAKDD